MTVAPDHENSSASARGYTNVHLTRVARRSAGDAPPRNSLRWNTSALCVLPVQVDGCVQISYFGNIASPSKSALYTETVKRCSSALYSKVAPSDVSVGYSSFLEMGDAKKLSNGRLGESRLGGNRRLYSSNVSNSLFDGPA